MPYYWINRYWVGIHSAFELRDLVYKCRVQRRRLKAKRSLNLSFQERRDLELEIFLLKLDIIRFRKDLVRLAY